MAAERTAVDKGALALELERSIKDMLYHNYQGLLPMTAQERDEWRGNAGSVAERVHAARRACHEAGMMPSAPARFQIGGL